MFTMIEVLQRSAASLAPVPPDVAREFRSKLTLLRQQVNRDLSSNPDLEGFIGYNSLESVYERSRYFAAFLATVFSYNAFDLMAENAAWSYQTYGAHGFAYDYFPLEDQAWMRAIDSHLKDRASRAVQAIARWRLHHHQDLVALYWEAPRLDLPLDPSWDREREGFFQSLLAGDYQESLQLANWAVTDTQRLQDFYLQVIQPSMYPVGNLWQRGEISVAQEHLASIITDRVMATVYPRVDLGKPSKGKVVIMMAPDDLHEIGARVVADFLALDGWDVNNLGAKIPLRDLLGFLADANPFLVTVSLAMPCSLFATQELFSAIKNRPELTKTRIMIGGQLFQKFPALWEVTGADGWAPDAQAAVALARQWWEEKTP